MSRLAGSVLIATLFATAAMAAPPADKAAAPAGKAAEPAAKPKKQGKYVAPPPQEVSITGCASPGTAKFCWILKTADGTLYSIGGQPIVEGKCYSVTGTPTAGTCRQGVQLSVAKMDESATNCCVK